MGSFSKSDIHSPNRKKLQPWPYCIEDSIHMDTDSLVPCFVKYNVAIVTFEEEIGAKWIDLNQAEYPPSLMTKTFKSCSFFHSGVAQHWLYGSFVTFFGLGMRIDNQFVKSVEQFDILEHLAFHQQPPREQIDLFTWSRNMKNNGRENIKKMIMVISSSLRNHELFYKH